MSNGDGSTHWPSQNHAILPSPSAIAALLVRSCRCAATPLCKDECGGARGTVGGASFLLHNIYELEP